VRRQSVCARWCSPGGLFPLDEVIDNGRAGNALSVTVGVTIVAFLLAMLVLLIKATSPRR